MQDDKQDKVGWIAILGDGTVLSESDGVPWGEAKDRAVGLSISIGGTTVALPRNMKPYVQGKTASCPFFGGDVKIESRWIGFDAPSGDRIVARVSEATGNVSIEVTKNDPSGDDKQV